jgi:general secretion pathway protein E
LGNGNEREDAVQAGRCSVRRSDPPRSSEVGLAEEREMRAAPILGRKYGELLASLEVVTTDDVNRAVAEQEKTGRDLDAILVDNGLTTLDGIRNAVSEGLGIETLDIGKVQIPQEILDLVPVRFVHRNRIIPLERTDYGLKVATADPLNYHAFDDLRLLLNCEIIPVLAYSKDIENAIKNYYGIGADTIDSMMQAEGTALEMMEAEGEIEELTEDATIIKFVNQIISEAVNDRATDIHIEPFEDELRIRYRIDGMLYEAAVPPTIKHYQSAVMSRIKIMADMNIAEKRLPQDGKIPFRMGGNEYDLRVSTVPTQWGESIAIRILSRTSTLMELEELGMDLEALRRFHFLIEKPHGIIFVTGPTGSGKTTTLYAALARLNRIDRKIITVEDPIEYDMHGLTQIQVHPKINLTFANILRSLLRHDPDIMLVGETRDYETAEITIRMALTGHLVFSTLHTNDAAGAITRLLDMRVEPFLVASSVIGIMAQRLVRLICPNCKEAYKPEFSELAAMGVPAEEMTDLVLHRGRGCEMCKFLGYRGRQGIFEIFPMSERIREMTVEHDSASKIKDQAIKEGMVTLRQYGWRLVRAGVTTVEEVLRVAQEDVEFESESMPTSAAAAS